MNLHHSHNFLHKQNINWHTHFHEPKIWNNEPISIPFNLIKRGFVAHPAVNKRLHRDEYWVNQHAQTLSGEDAMFDFDSVMRVRQVIRMYFFKKDRFGKISSYGLKHAVEGFLQSTFEDKAKGYVANGDFILAMSLEGFSYKRANNDINCVFNLSDDCAEILRRAKLPISKPTITNFQENGVIAF